MNPPDLSIQAIDLFCGVGGLSTGLSSQGVRVVAGVDVDPACTYPFKANHRRAKFLLEDVRDLTGSDLAALWKPEGGVRLLAGCAPCQPFSSYANTKTAADGSKWGLLQEFARLVEESLPELVTMENVPGLASEQPFQIFLDTLGKHGYQVVHGVLNAADYGAPQQRRRLVLLASRLGPLNMPSPTHCERRWVSVRRAIGHLPPIQAGQTCQSDPLHQAATLSDLNVQRIQASRPGGTWRDWPESLVAECHKKESGRHSGGVYGRMEWERPAPTMTTLCNGYGNGRFGHPEQHRAISLREAAIFQSFPARYKFIEPGRPASAKALARLIGNAVPPKLGAAVARALKASLRLAA